MTTKIENIIVFVEGAPHVLVPVATAALSARTPIEDVFSVRTMNALKKDGIAHVEELLFKPESEILRIPNIGRKFLNEINEVLEQKCGIRAGRLTPPRRE